MPNRAYQVALDADGDLYWLQRQGDKVQRYDSEPETPWIRRVIVRVIVRLFALLPIDWLL